jgi:hypothetical protein
VPQEDGPGAQGPGMVRIGRRADAAGWMQEEVADYNNNKRSDLSPTSPAHDRLKQGPMDDSHMVHEPQAVSALMHGLVVSEPQAVSSFASSAHFIISSVRMIRYSFKAWLHMDAANIDTDEVTNRFKMVQFGRRADLASGGQVEVAERCEAGTLDAMWFGRWADAAGWAQDEVADDNNNKCSDLTLQAQDMKMMLEVSGRFEAGTLEMWFGRWADAAGWAQDEVADDNNNMCSDLTLQAQYMKMARTGRWADFAERVRDEAVDAFDGSPVPKDGSPGAMFATAALLRELLTSARSVYLMCSSAQLFNFKLPDAMPGVIMARPGGPNADEAEEVAEDNGLEE